MKIKHECRIGLATIYTGDIPEEVIHRSFLREINRYYRNVRDIEVIRKTPEEIGGCLGLYGSYGIKGMGYPRRFMRLRRLFFSLRTLLGKP